MNHKPIYVVMHGPTPILPTGLWMSVRRRVEAFANAGIRTEVLVDQFSPDFDAQVTHLKRTVLHPDRIRLRSMHRDLSEEENYPTDVSYASPLPKEGWEFVRDATNPAQLRGWNRGKYAAFVSMRGDKVKSVDLLEDGKRSCRKWYDEAGAICRIDLMDNLNKPALLRYLRRDGSVYLESYVESNGSLRFVSLKERDGTVSDFLSELELFEYWLTNVLKGQVSPTIISEYAFRRESLQKLERRFGGKVFFTLHNNHLAFPHTLGSPVKPELSDVLENIDKISGLIVLTADQGEDIRMQYPTSNVIVIPHHVPQVQRMGVRSPKKVVMVARFDESKGQSDALLAFKLVLEEVAGATLDLYGRGPDEERIKIQIKSLGLSESVSVKGFTSDSFQVFAESAVSIVASSFEGFCLSLAESMACGCVPVSYDIKYGPRELIRQGVDGFLVPAKDVKAMATAITQVLMDDELRFSMSVAATSVAARFSEAAVVDAWSTALDLKR